ncbi:MAG: LCP family protein [Oscillospiraceae bacterium]|nr:LCP family protein [Oscillospiraceae bacterium]
MDNHKDRSFQEDNQDLLSMIRRHLDAENAPAPPVQPEPRKAKTAAESLRELEAITGTRPPVQTQPMRRPRSDAWDYSAAAERAASELWQQEDYLAGLPRFESPQRAAPARQGAPGQGGTRRRRRKHGFRRMIAAALIALLLLAGSGYGFAYVQAGKVKEGSQIAHQRGAGTASSLRVTNILLVGLDATRADTVLLLSIDRASKKLKLSSFLRDSWVELPDGGWSKLNAAVAKGGGALAETVERNFKVKIDHYMMVDFQAFEEIIDAMGGVSVPVTDKEADWLCGKTRLGRQIGRESMRGQMEQNGAVAMTGEQALIFCRIRYLDSDFGRTKRQRVMIERMAAQLKRTNPLKWMGIADIAFSGIETDMRQLSLTNLAVSLPFYAGFDVEQHTVPAENTYKDATKNGQSVLELNIEKNSELLRQFLYEE